MISSIEKWIRALLGFGIIFGIITMIYYSQGNNLCLLSNCDFNIETIQLQCEYACETDNYEDYCENKRTLRFNDLKKRGTCEELSKLIYEGLTIKTCPGLCS